MRSNVRALLLSSAACAVLFSLLFAAAYYTDTGRWLDNAALDGFLASLPPEWVREADAFAHLADPLPFAILTLAIVAAAMLRGVPRRGAAALVLLLGSAAFNGRWPGKSGLNPARSRHCERALMRRI